MRKTLFLMLSIILLSIPILGTIQDAVNNVVAYYPAENNRNDLINSSQNLAMTLPNMTDDYTAGIIGQSFYSKLKGVNESCSVNECGNSSRYNTTINNPQDIFTIDFWARSDFADGYHRHLLYLYKDLSNDIRISSPCSGAGACGDLAFQIINGSEVCGASSVPGVLLNNEFHHLIFGINGSHFNIWINGTKVNSTPCNVTVGQDWNKLVLGDRPDFTSTSWRWYGAIDNVFITSYPYDDITALDSYNNGNGTNFSFLLTGEPSIPPLNSTPENLTFKGTGQLPDPYIIENCPHLWSLNINTSAYFVLGNDIDCAGLNWNISFSDSINGVLNGRGYSIKNVMIDGNNQFSDLSMFTSLGNNSIIQNLWLENITIKRPLSISGMGVLSGTVLSSQFTIDNVHFRNINIFTNQSISTSNIGAVVGLGGDCNIIQNVSLENGYYEGSTIIGGIVGDIGDCQIKQSYVKNLTVKYFFSSFMNKIGGLLGEGSIETVLNDTFVKGLNIIPNTATSIQNVGGLGGFLGNSIIIDSYVFNNSINCSINSTHLFTNCGSLAGRCGTVTTSYADVESITPFGTVGVSCPVSAKKNISELIEIETFTGFDFNNIWDILNGTDTPFFIWEYDNSTQFRGLTNTPLNISDLNITNPELQEFILLNQIYEYFNGIWIFSYNVNDDDDLFRVNATIDDNESQIYFNQSSEQFLINLDSSLILNKNPFQIHIWVKNIFGDIVEQFQTFKINDSIIPFCIPLTNTSLNQSDIYNFNISCQDESFNFFNMTCQDYTNLNQSLDKKDFNYSDSFTITQNNSCLINYFDKFDNFNQSSFFIQSIPPIIDSNVTPPTTNVTVTVNVDNQVIADIMLNIFLMLLWILFLILTLTLKGSKGDTRQFLNILQLMTGLVAGPIWFGINILIGFTVVMVATGFFLGLIMKK